MWGPKRTYTGFRALMPMINPCALCVLAVHSLYRRALCAQAHASDSSRQAALEAKMSGMQQQLESRQDAIDQLKGDLAVLEAHHKQVSVPLNWSGRYAVQR